MHFQCRVGTIGRQSFAIQRLQQVQLPPLLARVQTAVVTERKGNILQGASALAVAHAAIPNSCAGAKPHKAKAASEHLQGGLGMVADVGWQMFNTHSSSALRARLGNNEDTGRPH